MELQAIFLVVLIGGICHVTANDSVQMLLDKLMSDPYSKDLIVSAVHKDEAAVHKNEAAKHKDEVQDPQSKNNHPFGMNGWRGGDSTTRVIDAQENLKESNSELIKKLRDLVSSDTLRSDTLRKDVYMPPGVPWQKDSKNYNRVRDDSKPSGLPMLPKTKNMNKKSMSYKKELYDRIINDINEMFRFNED